MLKIKPLLARIYYLLLGALLRIIRKGGKEFWISWKNMTKRAMLSDFFSVSASIGFVGIPALLVGVIFVCLSQGRDTLILVMEQTFAGSPWALLFLALSLCFWSVESEFSVRYAIYISDNTGKNLTDERVFWRKTVQKSLAGFFLLYPFLLILGDLIYCFYLTDYIPLGPRVFAFGISFLLLFLLMSVFCWLYFAKSGRFGHGKYLTTILGERSLPNIEQHYLRKL